MKRNYLVDSALTLEEKINGSFGNIRLLLQNKISSLEKQTGLWKIDGDGKNAVTLPSLAMYELKSLAQTYVGKQLGEKVCKQMQKRQCQEN